MRCAVVMQQGMKDRNANVDESLRIRFRVGINVGDVIIDEGDIFGDGVNVAARLEALAEPGEICVSATVREHVGEKLPIGFADLGEHSVKNIARPVQFYRIETRLALKTAAPGKSAESLCAQNSVSRGAMIEAPKFHSASGCGPRSTARHPASRGALRSPDDELINSSLPL